jgi:hypothetical protein
VELELKANVLLKRIAMLGDDGNLKHWLVGAHLKQPILLDLLVFYISATIRCHSHPFHRCKYCSSALLMAREEEKRNHGVIRKLLSDTGNNSIFTPIAMSASGAMGPSMTAFFQRYERAKAASKFEMRKQSELNYTWSKPYTMVASSFWDGHCA